MAGDLHTGDPEFDRLGGMMEPLSSRMGAILREMVDVEPRTHAGLRAKAETARRHLVADADDDPVLMEHESYFACAVLENVLGIAP